MSVESARQGPPPEDLIGIPAVGETIAGKFQVERILGVGGMGVVVAARHVHLGQKVAVKFLKADAAKKAEAVGRFLREARSAVGLNSEHVVRVTDVGTLDSGVPYMIMEHLQGVDLSDLLAQRGTLPPDEAVDYVLQACEAIVEAHNMGIVHRDLKPSNLFLVHRPDGTAHVKVLDFGISKALDAGAPGTPNPSLTATSSIMGSPMYMSPEQLRSSKNVDARTDIWAIGIMLYELIAGLPPFDADTVTGLCAMIVADQPTPLRARRPDVSPALEAVVMRCMEKDLARRWQSIGELAAALRPFTHAEAQRSADRISRLAGPGSAMRPPQASVPIIPPASQPGGQGGPSMVFGETVATWQTTGNVKKKRNVMLFVGLGAGAVVLLGACVAVAVALKSGSPATATAPPPATATQTQGTAAAVTQTQAPPPPPPPAVTLPPPATETHAAAPPAASTAAAPAKATTRPLAGQPIAAKTATPPPATTTATPPPAKTTTQDLLLDRK